MSIGCEWEPPAGTVSGASFCLATRNQAAWRIALLVADTVHMVLIAKENLMTPNLKL